MKELEKILEEIEMKKKKCLDIVRVEIDPMEITIHREQYKGLRMAEDIIRKHMNDGWIPVDERLPEKPENGYQEPEYNVMIKDAIIPTTLKFTSKGKWKDDLGQEYEIIAWRPLPEPYRPEGNSEE